MQFCDLVIIFSEKVVFEHIQVFSFLHCDTKPKLGTHANVWGAAMMRSVSYPSVGSPGTQPVHSRQHHVAESTHLCSPSAGCEERRFPDQEEPPHPPS